MPSTRSEQQVRAALAAVESDSASLAEKIEMLAEIAMGLQTQPKSPDDLEAAISLYRHALEICPATDFLQHARVLARMGTALQAMPGNTLDYLKEARDTFDAARKILKDHGTDEEVAEVEMNLGLVIQSLAGAGQAVITDAISAYQRALRTFDAKAHPKEYAILNNNLATAFLSMPFTDERAKMREALAVQAFEEGLKVVSLVDHPSEYAMLQNNLGNALQYVSSSHAVENNLRALDAYDEALKVRTRETTPLEYANTIANKANCLWNLPDDLENPEGGNHDNLERARTFYQEAHDIFSERGDTEKAEVVAGAITEIGNELGALAAPGKPNGSGAGAPMAR